MSDLLDPLGYVGIDMPLADVAELDADFDRRALARWRALNALEVRVLDDVRARR